MCAECGEGPSLLRGLEPSFPLGHRSLERGCWDMTHPLNRAAWLEKRETAFAIRNPLLHWNVLTGVGEDEEEPGVRLCCGQPCPGEGLSNSLWWGLEKFAVPALCQKCGTFWRGMTESGVQPCPACPGVCAHAVPFRTAEQMLWVLRWLQRDGKMQAFRVNVDGNLGRRKRQNILRPTLCLPYVVVPLVCKQLFCFQKPYHIKISDCNSSYCHRDVQQLWWADGGGAGKGFVKMWAWVVWTQGGRRVVEGPRGQCHLITVPYRFWNSSTMEMLMWVRSSGTSLVPALLGFLFSLRIKGKHIESCFTERPVLWRVPCRLDAGYFIQDMKYLLMLGLVEDNLLGLTINISVDNTQSCSFCSSMWHVWKPSQQHNRNASLSTVQVLLALCFCEWGFFP